MTKSIIVILVIFNLYFSHGQNTASTRKTIKYPLGYSNTIHIDSNGVFLFYTVDYQNFITRNIDRNDSIAKNVFYNRILLADLLNIINNNIYSTPKTKTASSGQIYYYYAPEDRFISHQTQTCYIKQVTYKKTSRKNFTMLIQVSTNDADESFEFKYRSKKPLNKYSNITDKLKNSKTIYRKYIPRD
ncbi:MAG: hypothetical protein SFY56_02520 [Bacteroidota bacterium]|nr:hypothetical protein [Bacteroidota bacterium]